MIALIIANNANNFFNFFKPLAEVIEKNGHTVFALDSQFSLAYNQVENFSYHVFSDFCNQQAPLYREKTEQIVKQIHEDYGSWLLYPDADRDDVYEIFPKYICSHQNELIYNLVHFFVYLHEDTNFDGVFYENASNAFALISREVARYYDVPYYGLSISRLPGRIAILDKWEKESEIYADIFSKYSQGNTNINKETVNYVESYIANISRIQPDYMTNNPLNNLSIIDKYFNLQKLKVVILKTKYFIKSDKWDFQIGNPLIVGFRFFLRNVKRIITLHRLGNYYEDFDSTKGEKYFLYPLHFHPEASTSFLAREYGDEYEVVRNIAYSLPYGTKLYIKDHMSAYGYPSLDFYTRLKKLPNVRVISPTSPTKEMIKFSLGVVTLASTVGYEALILEKPVIIFGNVFYEFHKNCLKCNSLGSIQSYLKRILNENFSLPKDYTRNFVAAYYDGTFPIKINYSDTNHENQLETAEKLLSTLQKLSN